MAERTDGPSGGPSDGPSAGPPREPTKLSDPRSLRALAHPVRNRLLYEIGARGSARVVDLARAIDVPANAVSFHLRELARYGLIVRDEQHGGDGRERWWKMAAPAGLTWKTDEMLEVEGGRAAVDVWRSHAAASRHALVDRFLALMEREVGEEYVSQGDAPMFLTDAEAREMGEEVYAVLRRWLEHGRARQAAGDTDGRRTYFTQVYTAPQDLLEGGA